MYDFNLGVQYVALYIDAADYSPQLAVGLLQYLPGLLEDTNQFVKMETRHPELDQINDASDRLHFAGRVFLYVDALLPQDEKEALAVYAEHDLRMHLKVRDLTYRDITLHGMPKLAFMSHDSRDKDELVRPLVHALEKLRCRVWYDEYQLRPGDSLRESIDRGLRDAPRCILVLSPNFLSNPGWGKGEFDAVMNRYFTHGRSKPIPVWHNVTASDVDNYSPLVANFFALKSEIGVDELSSRLSRILRTKAER